MDRSLLPKWRFCPYHGKMVRSCSHLDYEEMKAKFFNNGSIHYQVTKQEKG